MRIPGCCTDLSGMPVDGRFQSLLVIVAELVFICIAERIGKGGYRRKFEKPGRRDVEPVFIIDSVGKLGKADGIKTILTEMIIRIDILFIDFQHL